RMLAGGGKRAQGACHERLLKVSRVV
ncbi:MAG: hypothetical protein RL756_1724, partial [Pseudomonadota bacterium]